MERLNNLDNLATDFGIFEQKMYGYQDGDYILQVFTACEPSWFYVNIYDKNDELFGMGTFITDGKYTMKKIKYAKRIKVVERLLDKLINIKEKEYVCKD